MAVVSQIICSDQLIPDSKLKERWFFHREFNYEFAYMEEGAEISVRRVFPSK
jgi:hypothetical protein